MGITGLIPFLEKASKRGNISQFAGGTVAIDSYCWLHKGAFSCADKIALGQPTDAHVKYCMKLVHMLLANRIKPILVFDGRHLPAKKETEVKRRENRESTRRRAAELMRMGQTAEGRNLLRRSVDITHELALQLIKRCQEENVDCIVAPYEADAQLAYLNITGIADVVITEDSDLTLFGCKKIFFKMDINGNGLLVEQDRLYLAMSVRAENFEMDKFRHMCILSGCDYLASLPGIGLSKACKFILRNTEDDIHKALGRLGSYLNMKALAVTKEYRDAFIRALVTFKHQLVYCPLQRKQLRLYPPSPEVTEEQLHFAGDEISDELAYQMALGNYDPFTMQKLHDFDPDLAHRRRTNSWHDKSSDRRVSIWSREYKVFEEKENEETSEIKKWPDTIGKIVNLDTNEIKRKIMTPKKRNFGELAEELSANDALELYGRKKLQKNENSPNGRIAPTKGSNDSPCLDNEAIESPISSRHKNPFAKTTNDSEVSPSLISRGKRRIRLKNFVGFRPTVIDERTAETSKYFSPNSEMNDSPEIMKNNECLVDSCENMNDESIIEDEETMNDRESNFIAKTPDHDEISSSSGIFSSDPQTSPKNHSHVIDKTWNNDRDDDSPRLETLINDDTEKHSFVKNNIDDPRCGLFKWSNTKDKANKLVIEDEPTKRKSTVTARMKNTRNIASQRKSVRVEGQQSLLNMFGFQKKTVLKH